MVEMNRYFGLTLKTRVSPVSCLLCSVFFFCCCNCIPVVGLVKTLLIIPMLLIMTVVCFAYCLITTPYDIFCMWKFFYNSTQFGPHIKACVMVFYPMYRITFPFVQVIILPYVFIADHFNLLLRPCLDTMVLSKNYFTGGLEDFDKTMKDFIEFNIKHFTFKGAEEPDFDYLFDIPVTQVAFASVSYIVMLIIGCFSFIAVLPCLLLSMIPFTCIETCLTFYRTKKYGPHIKIIAFSIVLIVFPFAVATVIFLTYAILPSVLAIVAVIAFLYYIIVFSRVIMKKAIMKPVRKCLDLPYENIVQYSKGTVKQFGKMWAKFLIGIVGFWKICVENYMKRINDFLFDNFEEIDGYGHVMDVHISQVFLAVSFFLLSLLIGLFSYAIVIPCLSISLLPYQIITTLRSLYLTRRYGPHIKFLITGPIVFALAISPLLVTVSSVVYFLLIFPPWILSDVIDGPYKEATDLSHYENIIKFFTGDLLKFQKKMWSKYLGEGIYGGWKWLVHDFFFKIFREYLDENWVDYAGKMIDIPLTQILIVIVGFLSMMIISLFSFVAVIPCLVIAFTPYLLYTFIRAVWLTTLVGPHVKFFSWFPAITAALITPMVLTVCGFIYYVIRVPYWLVKHVLKEPFEDATDLDDYENVLKFFVRDNVGVLQGQMWRNYFEGLFAQWKWCLQFCYIRIWELLEEKVVEYRGPTIHAPVTQLFIVTVFFFMMLLISFFAFVLIPPLLSLALVPFTGWVVCSSFLKTTRFGPNIRIFGTLPFFLLVIFNAPVVEFLTLLLGFAYFWLFSPVWIIKDVLYEPLEESLVDDYYGMTDLIGRTVKLFGSMWKNFFEGLKEKLIWYVSWFTVASPEYLSSYFEDFTGTVFDIPIIQVSSASIFFFLAYFINVVTNLALLPSLSISICPYIMIVVFRQLFITMKFGPHAKGLLIIPAFLASILIPLGVCLCSILAFVVIPPIWILKKVVWGSFIESIDLSDYETVGNFLKEHTKIQLDMWVKLKTGLYERWEWYITFNIVDVCEFFFTYVFWFSGKTHDLPLTQIAVGVAFLFISSFTSLLYFVFVLPFLPIYFLPFSIWKAYVAMYSTTKYGPHTKLVSYILLTPVITVVSLVLPFGLVFWGVYMSIFSMIPFTFTEVVAENMSLSMDLADYVNFPKFLLSQVNDFKSMTVIYGRKLGDVWYFLADFFTEYGHILTRRLTYYTGHSFDIPVVQLLPAAVYFVVMYFMSSFSFLFIFPTLSISLIPFMVVKVFQAITRTRKYGPNLQVAATIVMLPFICAVPVVEWGVLVVWGLFVSPLWILLIAIVLPVKRTIVDYVNFFQFVKSFFWEMGMMWKTFLDKLVQAHVWFIRLKTVLLSDFLEEKFIEKDGNEDVIPFDIPLAQLVICLFFFISMVFGYLLTCFLVLPVLSVGLMPYVAVKVFIALYRTKRWGPNVKLLAILPLMGIILALSVAMPLILVYSYGRIDFLCHIFRHCIKGPLGNALNQPYRTLPQFVEDTFLQFGRMWQRYFKVVCDDIWGAVVKLLTKKVDEFLDREYVKYEGSTFFLPFLQMYISFHFVAAMLLIVFLSFEVAGPFLCLIFMPYATIQIFYALWKTPRYGVHIKLLAVLPTLIFIVFGSFVFFCALVFNSLVFVLLVALKWLALDVVIEPLRESMEDEEYTNWFRFSKLTLTKFVKMWKVFFQGVRNAWRWFTDFYSISLPKYLDDKFFNYEGKPMEVYISQFLIGSVFFIFGFIVSAFSNIVVVFFISLVFVPYTVFAIFRALYLTTRYGPNIKFLAILPCLLIACILPAFFSFCGVLLCVVHVPKFLIEDVIRKPYRKAKDYKDYKNIFHFVFVTLTVFQAKMWKKLMKTCYEDWASLCDLHFNKVWVYLEGHGVKYDKGTTHLPLAQLVVVICFFLGMMALSTFSFFVVLPCIYVSLYPFTIVETYRALWHTRRYGPHLKVLIWIFFFFFFCVMILLGPVIFHVILGPAFILFLPWWLINYVLYEPFKLSLEEEYTNVFHLIGVTLGSYGEMCRRFGEGIWKKWNWFVEWYTYYLGEYLDWRLRLARHHLYDIPITQFFITAFFFIMASVVMLIYFCFVLPALCFFVFVPYVVARWYYTLFNTTRYGPHVKLFGYLVFPIVAFLVSGITLPFCLVVGGIFYCLFMYIPFWLLPHVTWGIFRESWDLTIYTTFGEFLKGMVQLHRDLWRRYYEGVQLHLEWFCQLFTNVFCDILDEYFVFYHGLSFDIPITQVALGMIQYVVMYLLMILIAVVAHPIFTLVSLPRTVWIYVKAVFRTNRYGPNIKALLLLAVIPLVLLTPVFMLLFITFVIVMSAVFILVRVFGLKLWRAVEEYLGLWSFLKENWYLEKLMWKEYIGGILLNLKVPHLLFPKALEKLIMDDEHVRRYDVPIHKMVISLIVGFFWSMTLPWVMVYLAVMKSIPILLWTYYHMLVEFYIEGIILHELNSSHYFGPKIRQLGKAGVNLAGKSVEFSYELFKLLYVTIPVPMLKHVKECFLFTSIPLLISMIILYVPLLVVFPFVFLVGASAIAFVMVLILCLIGILVVMFFILVCVLSLTLPILFVPIPPTLFILYWTGIIILSFFYGYVAVYWSFKGRNMKEYFTNPLYLVIDFVHNFDKKTNWFVEKEDKDKFSFVPCFKVSEDVLETIHDNMDAGDVSDSSSDDEL